MKTKRLMKGAWVIPVAVFFLPALVTAELPPATQPAAPTTRPAEAGGRSRAPGAFLNRLHELVNGLNLTADQTPKVDALFATASDDMKSAIASAREQGADRRQTGQKIRSIMKNLRDGLKTVLTDDQVQALQKKLPGSGRANGGGAGQLLQRLQSNLEKLKLSKDQKKQMVDVLKASRRQFEKIRGEASNGSDEAREKIRAAFEDTREKLENILTPDQKEKLKQIRQEREQGGGPATRPQ